MIRVIRALTCLLFIVCAWLAVFAEQDVTLFLILLFAAMLGVLVLTVRRRS